MIYLAYDGSLSGDWVARYALRLALHNGGRLTAVHVLDGTRREDEIDTACDRLRDEGLQLGVDVSTRILPVEKNVLHTLLRAIPAEDSSLVVCGTRMRPRQSTRLAGTLAEKLLHSPRRFATLALRVVHPGMLGAPRDVLLPFSGHPRGLTPLLPFFHLLAPDLERIEVLRGIPISALRLRHLTWEQRALLHDNGVRDLAAVKQMLDPAGDLGIRIDGHVLVCDDWEHEIAVQANRLKTRLILVGFRPRPLARRLLSGAPLERLLHGAPCDVAVYRAP